MFAPGYQRETIVRERGLGAYFRKVPKTSQATGLIKPPPVYWLAYSVIVQLGEFGSGLSWSRSAQFLDRLSRVGDRPLVGNLAAEHPNRRVGRVGIFGGLRRRGRADPEIQGRAEAAPDVIHAHAVAAVARIACDFDLIGSPRRKVFPDEEVWLIAVERGSPPHREARWVR